MAALLHQENRRLLVAALCFWFLAVLLQPLIDRDRPFFRTAIDPTRLGQLGAQSRELFGGVLVGFREVAAGLLWVKADDYFHSGEYDKLVPLFYLVTWLDPHNLDAYSTGAWHLAYNLGDHRLIPEGLHLLLQGVRNNPSVFDLYFQVGWMYFDKIKDFGKAVEWFRRASRYPQTDGKPTPFYVRHMLAHALEKNGQIEDCIQQWRENVRHAEERVRQNPESTDLQQELAVARHNLDVTLLRRDFFRKGAGQPGYFFNWSANPPRWMPSGDSQVHQQDVQFDYKVIRLAPRKLKIVGHMEGMDFRHRLRGHQYYVRIALWFRDADYEQRMKAHEHDFEWQKDNITFYRRFDYPFPSHEKGNEFVIELDFSKDPEDWGRDPAKLFPLKGELFKLTVWLDPMLQGEFIQDFTGWKGEGLTDKRYVITDERGVRLISKTVILKREDLLEPGQAVIAE